MSGAVIELGFAQPWEPEPEPPPRWPPRPPTWLVPALVAGATLLTLGAAAAPKQWDPVLSQRDQNTSLRFGPDDTAYLTTQRSRSARLQAYRPDRAGALWTVNFPGGYPVPVLDDNPGLLTVSVYDADPDGQGTGNAVQGRDPRTGRMVWTRPGTGLLGAGAEVAVVTNRQEGGGPVPGPAAFDRFGLASGSGVVMLNPLDGSTVTDALPTGQIEAVDRRTGQTRWTRAVAPDVLLGTEDVPDDRAPHIVELSLDGRLRLSDPTTGDVRHESRLALIGKPLHVSVTGDVVVVHQEPPDGDPRVSMAYDLASGAARWSQDTESATFCGDRYLCVSDPGTLTVTDLASGSVRFQGRSDLYMIHGDRLIVSWEAIHPRPAGTQVYDLRTGRRSHDYPGWFLASFEVESSLLVQQTSGGMLLVSTVAHATGRVTMVGRATDWIGTASCTRGDRYVGCVGPAGVRIWRLPREN